MLVLILFCNAFLWNCGCNALLNTEILILLLNNVIIYLLCCLTVFYEVCYSADPPKFQQRGWSHAASVPSEEPEAPKGQKRVPRHQRRAMVESFVNKYFFVSFYVEALFPTSKTFAFLHYDSSWHFGVPIIQGCLHHRIPALFRLFFTRS